jgi:hypothetical protein
MYFFCSRYGAKDTSKFEKLIPPQFLFYPSLYPQRKSSKHEKRKRKKKEDIMVF